MQGYLAYLQAFSQKSFAVELLWWTRLMMLFAAVYFGLKICLVAKNVWTSVAKDVWTSLKELKGN